MIDTDVFERAESLLQTCRDAGVTIATVESCTGGLVAASLTEVAGSSSVVDRGFVTYTNEAKNELVGVPMHLFEQVGAVSEEVARAMAEGALTNSNAEVSGSVTGVAGPSGGTVEKPVGLVHMSVARKGYDTLHLRSIFEGDRNSIRLQSVSVVIDLMRCQAELP